MSVFDSNRTRGLTLGRIGGRLTLEFLGGRPRMPGIDRIEMVGLGGSPSIFFSTKGSSLDLVGGGHRILLERDEILIILDEVSGRSFFGILKLCFFSKGIRAIFLWK